MKKIFSKKAIIIAILTYVLILMAFCFGYLTHHYEGGLIDLGPNFSGFATSVITFPFVVIGSIIFIAKTSKPNVKFTIIGYLILTIGVIGVIIIGNTILESYRSASYAKEQAEKVKQENEYISTISAEVRKVYPNAEFYMEKDATIVKLSGYKYKNLPNFDDEITKWKKLKQISAIRNYPYRILIEYYFENTEDYFALLHINDYKLYYSSSGMPKEEIDNLKQKMQEYLYNYYDTFDIKYDYIFDVTIYKRLNSNEKIEARKIWQNFVEQNKINPIFPRISVEYNEPNTDTRYYDVLENRWS